jgi:hypothetical protein
MTQVSQDGEVSIIFFTDGCASDNKIDLDEMF